MILPVQLFHSQSRKPSDSEKRSKLNYFNLRPTCNQDRFNVGSRKGYPHSWDSCKDLSREPKRYRNLYEKYHFVTQFSNVTYTLHDIA